MMDFIKYALLYPLTLCPSFRDTLWPLSTNMKLGFKSFAIAALLADNVRGQCPDYTSYSEAGVVPCPWYQT